MSDRTLVEKVRVTDVLKAQAQAFRLDTGHGTQIGPGITRDGNVVRLLMIDHIKKIGLARIMVLSMRWK